MERIKEKTSFSGTLALSAAMTAAAHPLTYVKVLIQVGHEPIAPVPATTIFGKQVWYLPNVFQYARYIKQVDGWFGLYRGVGPRVVHNIVNTSICNAVSHNIKEMQKVEDDAAPPPDSVQQFIRDTGNAAVSRAAGVLVSYPLHMISVRMMVQFIGREVHYQSIWSSMKEIYQEEGILGFFSGIVPHLIGELLSLTVFRTLTYLINTYIIDHELIQLAEMRNYSSGVSQYVANMITYPFTLVANLMVVNQTRLVAGNPPLMPIYESWTHCWVELGKKGLRNRGSSLFRRAVHRI